MTFTQFKINIKKDSYVKDIFNKMEKMTGVSANKVSILLCNVI